MTGDFVPDEIPELAGQILVGGFAGAELPVEMRRALAAGHRAGAILFKRNLPSLEAAGALSSEIVSACPAELPAWVGVDQEGGRVGRLPAPFLRLPPMRAIGALDDPELAERVGRALGDALLALGFNLDFAPVLDVDSNPENPVIGDRAFGADPLSVTRLALPLARGLQAAGVAACGKHYPGHGDTHTDSHFELPIVVHDKVRLRAIEIAPFAAAAKAGIATLMTAHVVYMGLDPDAPATLSSKIATSILRDELGFEGVLFSDDLEMRALADRMTIEESAVAAVRAGCDALLVCSDFALQEAAHAALVREAERDPNFRLRLSDAARRCLACRRRYPSKPAAFSDRISESARALETEIGERIA